MAMPFFNGQSQLCFPVSQKQVKQFAFTLNDRDYTYRGIG